MTDEEKEAAFDRKIEEDFSKNDGAIEDYLIACCRGHMRQLGECIDHLSLPDQIPRPKDWHGYHLSMLYNLERMSRSILDFASLVWGLEKDMSAQPGK